jgi:hypothetical protein
VRSEVHELELPGPAIALQGWHGAEVSQCTEAGEKEVRAAADGYELRKSDDTGPRGVLVLHREIAGHRASSDRLAVAEQRVVLSA